MIVRKPVLAILSIVVILTAFSLRRPATSALAVVDVVTRAKSVANNGKAGTLTTDMDLRLHPPSVAKDAQKKALFLSQSWQPPAAKPPLPLAVASSQTSTPPTLPFRFLGKMYDDIDHQGIFLVRDDRVYAAHVGDVLDDHYKVERIDKGTMTFTYLPLNQTQTLSIGSE